MPNTLHARLLPHPTSPAGDVDSIDVCLHAGPAGIAIDYRVSGRIDRLVLPRAPASGRTDGLWQTTCCELFVGKAGDTAYREFNFAPSGQWAAYDFAAPRQRAADPDLAPPTIRTVVSASLLHLAVTVPWCAGPVEGSNEVGLSAVLETRGGIRSYWALHHPGPVPDFHDRASFALRMDPTP